ncbi:MAG: Gfo/Idh/MocA family protein, partial [Candidatus Hodarchaeota archaeon]
MGLRIGIIGCGLIANLGHALWYRENPDAEITAVADPNVKHLNKFASKYKVQNKFEDPIDLIESGEVDAVSICGPHWVHCSQAVEAIKQGIHVLVEKPMAVSMDECDLIGEEVNKRKVVFQVATQKRFHYAHQKIKEMLVKGKIGEPFQASIYWYHYIPDIATGFYRGALELLKKLKIDLEDRMGAWRLTDHRAGGGDLMDHLPHYYDLFRFWLGEPEYLCADILRVFPGRSHEDHGIIQIKYKSGAL